MEKESEKTPQHFGGLGRIFRALGYSIRGLNAVFREEAAFRQELYIGLILTLAAFCLPLTGWERLLMLGSWVLVMVTEVLNSAIEGLCDYICQGRDSKIGQIKDMASAAVFLAILLAVGVWICVLWRLY